MLMLMLVIHLRAKGRDCPRNFFQSIEDGVGRRRLSGAILFDCLVGLAEAVADVLMQCRGGGRDVVVERGGARRDDLAELVDLLGQPGDLRSMSLA